MEPIKQMNDEKRKIANEFVPSTDIVNEIRTQTKSALEQMQKEKKKKKTQKNRTKKKILSLSTPMYSAHI